jgi:N-acetylneuraminic acid mutarotase
MRMLNLCMFVCASVLVGLASVPSATAQTALPAPYFTPASGTYNYNFRVAMNESVPYMTIYYTTDGSTPTPANWTQYTGAIPVTSNMTFKAIAVDGVYPYVYANSPVSTVSYVLDLPNESPLPRGEWAWEGGGTSGGGCPTVQGAAGVYGTLGVPSAANIPSGRAPAASWTDKNGNFWVFGGYTVAAYTWCDYVNDLWMFNPSTKEWAWMSGSSTYVKGVPQPGTYGTLGQFAPGNVPSAREYSVGWTDESGNLWLFGGDGYDSTGTYGYLNDLWEFNPTTRQWAWIAGSKFAGQKGAYGYLHELGANNAPGGRWGAVGWADRNGNLWLFSGYGDDAAGNGSIGEMNDLWKFNIATRQWAWMAGSHLVNHVGEYGTHDVPSPNNIPGARSNAMAWVDAKGEFWLFGGEGLGAGIYGGALNDLWEFNPSNLNWTWAAGYADVDSLNGQRTYAQAGIYDTLGVPDPGNTPGGRYSATTWTDAQGNLWLFGGVGNDSVGGGGPLNDLWEFDRTRWLWAWMGGSEVISSSLTAYGPYRVPSAQTLLGARSGSAGWTDKNGNLWIFGGTGYGRNYGPLNDLFEYQLP